MALIKELENRKGYLGEELVETIYIGGGTPSVLSPSEIEMIIMKIFDNYQVSPKVEITIEANPDDLTSEYLSDISKMQINRLSIGIQSFSDESLSMLGRRHNAGQAIRCVEDAFKAGFENISIDLIYGLPATDNKTWEENLRRAFLLPIKHLSAYHLTYHKRTHLNWLLGKGIIHVIPEDASYAQFLILIESSRKNNFEQYEISNFAKEGRISGHNCSYWFGKKYLGIGPSAHSYNQATRSWNISDLPKYIKGIEVGMIISETEILSEDDKFNDYIITRLRTKWGITEEYILDNFGKMRLLGLVDSAKKYISNGYMTYKNGNYILSDKGLFVSDKIMEDLIFIKSG